MKNGIIVISTDLEAIGRTVAQAIPEDKTIVQGNLIKVIKKIFAIPFNALPNLT